MRVGAELCSNAISMFTLVGLVKYLKALWALVVDHQATSKKTLHIR